MYRNVSRAIILWCAIFLLFISSPSRSQSLGEGLDLFDISPHLLASAAPNLLLTFDDSDKMYRGYMPDYLGTDSQHDLHAAKSSHYNKLYYNPDKNYRPAKNHLGEFLPDADFYAALNNPFVIEETRFVTGVSRGERISLASEYKVRWSISSPENISAADGIPARATDDSDAMRNGAAYYYRYDPALNPTQCIGTEQQKSLLDVCYRYVEVRAPQQLGGRDERGNFANWYQYHSLAILAAKTIASQLFSPETIPSGVRLGRQTLGVPGFGSVSSDNVHGVVQPLDLQNRESVYNWLFGIEQARGGGLGDALVLAGNFLSSQGAASPYRQFPWHLNDAGEEVSCRVSHHLMITNGFFLDRDPFSSLLQPPRFDEQLTLPDGRAYRPEERGQTVGEQTAALENLSLYYWASDLRADLENNVPPLSLQSQQDDTASYWDRRNDPANWQHMVTHIISLGETDLEHVATASRGDFIDAINSDTLKTDLNTLASRFSSHRFGSSMGLTDTTSALQGEVLYQAQFDENGGHLVALDISSGSPGLCGAQFGESSCRIAWDVADRNSQLQPSNKKILSYDPELKQGIDFSWSALSPQQKQALNANDNLGEKRVDYLRGSSAYEEKNGGSFKNRKSAVLGPIINSTPLYVGNGISANGAALIIHPDDLEDSHGQSYSNFLCESGDNSGNDVNASSGRTCASGGIAARQPMVYVASNDGLMHGYTAALNGGGEEVFSYVPAEIIKKIPRVSSAEIAYSATVDGVLTSSDVFFNDSDKRWHTLLIGGLRTGGQGYFALDITDPALFKDSANAKRLVLWEFTDKDDPDLGYSFSKPVIVKSNYRRDNSESTGRWVVVFGNGYQSGENDDYTGSSQAVLFIVDAETGDLIRKITTGRGDIEHPNALATPGVIYNDDDLRADYVYAGDLQGNMWKFDISSSDPEMWAVAYGANTRQPDSPHYAPKPLFSASLEGQSQAITSAPIVGAHPGGLGGLMIYFGTGKYLEHSDQLDSGIQSFYALWDKNLCDDEQGGVISCAEASKPLSHRSSPIIRENLLQQKISGQSGGQRSGSNHAILWAQKRGWYIDLDSVSVESEASEKVLSQPLISGQLVLFSTFIPSDNACSAGGESWLMAVSKSNGGVPQLQPFDFNNDGYFDRGDYLGEQVAFGKKLSNPQFGISRVGCGGRACIVSNELTPINEGMRWGRWRWQVLSE